MSAIEVVHGPFGLRPHVGSRKFTEASGTPLSHVHWWTACPVSGFTPNDILPEFIYEGDATTKFCMGSSDTRPAVRIGPVWFGADETIAGVSN